MSFEDLYAFSMSGVHLDHRDCSQKARPNKQPSLYKNDNPEDAVVEWAKCESFCAFCHDIGENSAGVRKPKRYK